MSYFSMDASCSCWGRVKGMYGHERVRNLASLKHFGHVFGCDDHPYDIHKPVPKKDPSKLNCVACGGSARDVSDHTVACSVCEGTGQLTKEEISEHMRDLRYLRPEEDWLGEWRSSASEDLGAIQAAARRKHERRSPERYRKFYEGD